jgi:hypothetical protein
MEQFQAQEQHLRAQEHFQQQQYQQQQQQQWGANSSFRGEVWPEQPPVPYIPPPPRPNRGSPAPMDKAVSAA